MKSEEFNNIELDACYPVLIIPKRCTTLEADCENDELSMKLKITTLDAQELESLIYSGLCKVKVTEICNVDHNVMKMDNNLIDSDNVTTQLEIGQVTMNDEINLQTLDLNINEELESLLPEELMLAGESIAQEIQYVDLGSDNAAVQQPMAADLFTGESAREGRNIQKIAVNDPKVVCTEVGVGSDLVGENLSQKKYQCDRCQQMFGQLAAFRQHLQIKQYQGEWTEAASGRPAGSKGFECAKCGKHYKTRGRFASHWRRHGNPDLECQKCHKVFTTKTTLNTHSKLHLRKQKKSKKLRKHLRRMHCVHQCDRCSFSSSKREDLLEHERGHGSEVCASDCEATVSLDGWREAVVAEDVPVKYERTPRAPDGQDPDSVIAKVISSEMFFVNVKKANKLQKICNICHKTFSRASYVKRHLIDHVIRSTLVKHPVNDSGTRAMLCVVCKAQIFRRIGRYKAHLRQHAKLTMYQCTFCDKSFSDSSNFSKHKKQHSTVYLQCEHCRRKFISKETLIVHLQNHNKMEPLRCNDCD